ncbi:MAG: DUF512 domain-containing protein [Candidatus Marinimicrobia bacterium]|nr:DUF512 domain-containing protein [Candidatus Neomarinimicrobiota bacterium]
MAITAVKIESGSIAEDYGLQSGDRILTINGNKIHDQLDYNFYTADENLEFEIQRKDEYFSFFVQNEEFASLGIVVEEMQVRKCTNNCVFCFVDQLPKGLRRSLYFKDGDYRFSFLHGHYVTLTNVGKTGLQRIVEQRLSPLYISVHTTEPKSRQKLLLYGKDDGLMKKLRFLRDNEIEFHTQIVLCPGINDGAVLEKTIEDLNFLLPATRSIALVPVGLTAHRDGLMPLKLFDKKMAQNFIYESEKWSDLQNLTGDRLVQIADEFYVLADLQFPVVDYYGEFENIENGVGLVRNTLDEFEEASGNFPDSLPQKRKIHIATGTAAAVIFEKHFLPKLNRINELQITIHCVKNTVFGDSVNVANLLGGKCIVDALKGVDLGDLVVLPPDIFNIDGLTIDDFTLSQLENELGANVRSFMGDYDMLWRGID